MACGLIPCEAYTFTTTVILLCIVAIVVWQVTIVYSRVLANVVACKVGAQIFAADMRAIHALAGTGVHKHACAGQLVGQMLLAA